MGCLSLFGNEAGLVCSSCRSKLKSLYLSGKAQALICRDCGEVVRNGVCQGCGMRSPDTLTALSAYEYDGVIRELIHRFKYDGVFALSRWMAEEMRSALNVTDKRSFSMIVPVPMHPLRLLTRGYNQSAKLAKALSRLLGVRSSGALKRIKNTRSQVGLATQERRRNLKNAFRVVRPVSGEKILLLDDVRTTGSTAAECARSLLAAGCASVTVLTFASAAAKEKAPFSEQSDAGNRT